MNNLEKVNNQNDVPFGELSNNELIGSWEQKDKNLTAAAITVLFVVGAIYFNVQSILMFVFTITYKVIYDIILPSNLIKMLDTIASEFKMPILFSLVISQYFFMLAPSIWIVNKWHTHKVKKYLRVNLCSLKEIFLAVLITISALPLCYFISSLLIDSLNIPKEFKDFGSQLFTAASPTEFIVLIFVVAITPAICEEIFFRGYFQRTLERTQGWKSVLWTGLLFGLFHLQPLSLIVLTILGMLFSFFYYRSKSIFPSSFAHFTNNFIALYLLYSQSQQADIVLSSDSSIPIGWVILSTLLGVVLFWVYYKITEVNKKLYQTKSII